MSKNESYGLNHYGAEPFEQQQFGTAAIEGVNNFLNCALFFLFFDLNFHVRLIIFISVLFNFASCSTFNCQISLLCIRQLAHNPCPSEI